ncbi:hypothetical protein SAMD00023353_0802530 [Rosellinia necatrix]|uniref:Uncharacterized protein n=1 Tax=Rosellinia necatrix TaxID=77044 RepID=A0A1S8A631_ROSNE|nr:hypothetical protein SAMD00023353_0802530 [Rosellinia necatrix]
MQMTLRNPPFLLLILLLLPPPCVGIAAQMQAGGYDGECVQSMSDEVAIPVYLRPPEATEISSSDKPLPFDAIPYVAGRPPARA